MRLTVYLWKGCSFNSYFYLHFPPLFALLLNVETFFFFQFSKVDRNTIIATVYADKNKGQKILHNCLQCLEQSTAAFLTSPFYNYGCMQHSSYMRTLSQAHTHSHSDRQKTHLSVVGPPATAGLSFV